MRIEWRAVGACAGLATVALAAAGCSEQARQPRVEVVTSQPAASRIVLQVAIAPDADGAAVVRFFDGFGATHREVEQSTVRIDQRAAAFALREGVSTATAEALAVELRASAFVARVVVDRPTPDGRRTP